MLLHSVKALEPLVRAAADEAEASRRYPDRVVDALAQTGLFRALVPRCLGGLEIDPLELLDVVEEVSRWDGSAGWLAMIGSGASFLSGYLADDLVRAVFDEPNAFLCGNLGAPTARAKVVPGGFRINGQWPFVSGCEHATWLGGMAVLPDGSPRILVFPRVDCEILDTWSVTGLRATGSHDVAVRDVFVPGEWSFWWADGPRQPQPLFRIRFMLITHAAHGLGIARAAIDSLTQLAETKVPTRGGGLLKERGVVQSQVAQAEALVLSARDFMRCATSDAWQAAHAEGAVPARVRVQLRLAMTQAVLASAQAVDLMWAAAGGSPIYTNSPLERCFRDIHVATQHAAVSELSWETLGKGLFDAEFGATLI
ncbi:MAG TPA: acyl-CoA dehydrogenase family protein [Chloroflexota bacterium]|nr:acyl-CoA dehydrogenase family protein [Chloroflexota bacterium]